MRWFLIAVFLFTGIAFAEVPKEIAFTKDWVIIREIPRDYNGQEVFEIWYDNPKNIFAVNGIAVVTRKGELLEFWVFDNVGYKLVYSKHGGV